MRTRVVTALLLLTTALSPRAEILEQVLVKVNGDILTKTDLEQRQITFLRQRSQAYSEADLKTDAGLKKILAEITPQILVDAIDEMLLVQRGRELGYRLGDEQFKSIIDNIKTENKLETEEQFQVALKQEGLTMADLRRSLERQMLVSRVQQVEVLGRIGVTETEERAYYEAHRSDFTTPATVTLREILIAVPAATDPATGQPAVNVGVEEQAREKAESMRQRLLAGEDFGKLAGEVSDAPSKANAGLVGPLNLSELAPGVQALVVKLKVGELTEAVRTNRGFQILKLDASTDAVIESFEQARPKIAEQVYNSKRGVEYDRYVRRLRAQAIIEWKNQELKSMYEARVKAAGTNGG